MGMRGEGDEDVHRKIEKRSKKNKEKDKKKRKLELKNDEREYEKFRKKDKRIKMEKDQYNIDGEAAEIKEASKEKTQVEGGKNRRGLQMNDRKDCELEARKDKKKRHKEKRNKDGIDTVSSLKEILEDDKLGKDKVVKGWENYEKEDVAEMKQGEEGDKNKTNKRGKKDKEGSDVEGKSSTTNGKETRKARNHSDGDIMEKVKHAKERKRKKKKDKDDLGADVAEMKKGEEGDKNKTNKRGKKDKEASDVEGKSSTTNGKETRKARNHSDGDIMEKVKHAKERKRKKKKDTDDLGADVTEMKKGKEGDKNKMNKRGKKDKEGSDVEGKSSTTNGKETRKARTHSDGDIMEKVKHAKERKRKKKKDKDDLGAGLREVPAVKPGNGSTIRTSKRVRFSGHVEVFPSSDGPSVGKKNQEENLVRGKRFSQEEDEMIKESVSNYIEGHGLGEEGLNMVLRCKSYPEIKNCWKEIATALPWRPSESIYYRAHILFERAERRVWTSEEYELVRKFHEQHGSDWRMLADTLGKHRFHVKDTWRRIKLPNMKKGHWSQAEYQNLFDLVNTDLRMKAFEEKKSKHGMLRDNICWGAISDMLSTRSNANCCLKWYNQLTSSMVAEGKWADTDDYRLLNALFNLDACCMEDVDWDNLLDHRSGDVCRKRWNQMFNHIGKHGNESFAEQVEVLSKRYCPDILEAREAYDSKPAVP